MQAAYACASASASKHMSKLDAGFNIWLCMMFATKGICSLLCEHAKQVQALSANMAQAPS